MNILLSGSGSGGHIYPCIALYKRLKEKHSVYILIFKEIDKKIYDLNKIKYLYIDNENSVFKKITLINNIIKDNKIDKTVTFGGKNSFYINLIAKKNKIDNYIFEQNVILGKANKANYHISKKIFTTFKIGLKKEIHVGNPNAYNLTKSNKKLFNNKLVTILITMGSLGSSSTNKIIEKFIKNNNDKYNFIYISGNNVKTTLKESNNIKIYNFYNPLSDLIKCVDIVISRAGASTLSEIINLNIPSIIIPSPYVANNHQEKNALYLYKNKAIELIYEKDLNESILSSKLINLTNNKTYFNELKNNLKKLSYKDNFNVIERIILSDNS